MNAPVCSDTLYVPDGFKLVAEKSPVPAAPAGAAAATRVTELVAAATWTVVAFSVDCCVVAIFCDSSPIASEGSVMGGIQGQS